MSDRKPIARITFTADRKKHSVASVWSGNYPGTYSFSRDKGTDKFPSIGMFDALKAWGLGQGFIDISIESEREPMSPERRGGGSYDRSTSNGAKADDGFGGGDSFEDDGIPF